MAFGVLGVVLEMVGADSGHMMTRLYYLFFVGASLVVGVLGWLLVKKKVLQCDNCGAVIAAS